MLAMRCFRGRLSLLVVAGGRIARLSLVLARSPRTVSRRKFRLDREIAWIAIKQ